MSTNIEYRSIALAAPTEPSNTVKGDAIVYGTVADIAVRGPDGRMRTVREVFEPRAFQNSVEDTVALFEHNMAMVLGRRGAGTLRLAESDRGVAVEIDLPDTTCGRDVRSLVERQDVRGISVGFIADEAPWELGEDRIPIRRVKRARLVEISLTSSPIYKDTSAVLKRSLGEFEAESDNTCRKVEQERQIQLAAKRFVRL